VFEAVVEAIARVAAAAGLPQDEAREAVTVPRERERADLTLPCFRWAKAQKRAPTEIAAGIAQAFEPSEWLESAEAVGPFVNFRLIRSVFTARTLEAIGDTFGSSSAGDGKTVVIDYGSPNIAKPLLFHHLRSAVIGQALCNIHRMCGYTVVGLNYLGDVGTAFGKLMVGIEEFGEVEDSAGLNETYVRASALCAESDEKMAGARAWAKRLEDNEPDAVRLWENARRISLEGFATIYDWLGVHHDVVDGEQMYVRLAGELADRLDEEGKARVSDGALVLDPEDPRLGVLLLRKSDGATLYQTRDVAAAIDRQERFGFDRMLYVVDVAQEHYFKQLFSGLLALGHEWADRCRHVAFGQVLMGGRRAKTREGRGILLEEVLAEGERRALDIIEEKNADLADKESVARAVGVGAVIHSDLGFPARKNINFDWDEVLSFDGRTGPYLQYVHASAASILRKGGESGEFDPALLEDDLEWDLVRRLAEFPDVIAKACEECEPSDVAAYLYDLARGFRAYHTAGSRDASLRVLVDDPPLREARLALVDAVRRTLAIGLRLICVEPVEEM
jgi:arginyl-tRNA synthetase